MTPVIDTLAIGANIKTKMNAAGKAVKVVPNGVLSPVILAKEIFTSSSL